MAKNNCVVSVAFRKPYVEHSKRQEIALHQYDCDTLFFRDKLPVKDGIETNDVVGTFQKSLYGFKPHAIQKAIDKGYIKVIWLDPSVLPTCDIKILFDSLDNHPMIVRTGSHPLIEMTGDKAMKWFGFTKENIEGVNHIGGTVYGFNFDKKDVSGVFSLWKRAEEEGIFGTQDEFMKGHWADESCMALAMHTVGMPQYWESDFTYRNQKEM